jgi:diacylglycerol O-acyltransferase / wax synthase
MSDPEALMWQVEKDPWLNPSGGVVVFLDRPADPEFFRACIASAVAKIPRLYERVVSPVGRVANPQWVPDEEFDLDWHVRRIALPSPATDRHVLDLATRLLEDPYDRTRPLWQFVLIEGLAGGRGALFWKLHHTLMDGKAAIRLTELFTQLDRVAPAPPPVDLDRIVADAVVEHQHRNANSDDQPNAASGSGPFPPGVGAAASQLGSLVRGPVELMRRFASEAMLLGSDPARVTDLGSQAKSSATQLRDVLSPPTAAGSSLWVHRSRRRGAESVSLPLDAVKAAAKTLGGTVNDVFVTGVMNGVVAFHEQRRAPVDHLNFSFVVSTRTDDAIGGNSFTPAIASATVAGTSAAQRFESVRELMTSGRSSVGGGGGLIAKVAALARLLPTSTVTGFARRQAAAVDFATSNMRGTPVPAYIAGALLERNVTLGPVAGTAFNATALSMVNSLDIGLHLDIGAIDDPTALRDCIEEAFRVLFEVANSVR